eukprot:TRINITY_DN1813_c4_g1_i1.p3 TRINITY_DN1813_c4_g1~~TRINITY_DN1813_c4_g1_i1.p3  ORF type:complete len:211 (-),score=15.76 TRINITY_DN1813_c4_g1_i1:1029-1661(-)
MTGSSMVSFFIICCCLLVCQTFTSRINNSFFAPAPSVQTRRMLLAPFDPSFIQQNVTELDEMLALPQTERSPSPDVDMIKNSKCSQKLEKLQECHDQKEKFLALGITHYSYNIWRSCFCFPPKLTQEAGISVCGDDSTLPDTHQDHNTMAKVFDFLCDEIINADIVDVTYDVDYHYPVSMFIHLNEMSNEGATIFGIGEFDILTKENCVV